MKLQLSPSQISSAAGMVGHLPQQRQHIRTDVQATISALTSMGIVPFTRKDIIAILVACGYVLDDLANNPMTYGMVSNALGELAEQAVNNIGDSLRGYYVPAAKLRPTKFPNSDEVPAPEAVEEVPDPKLEEISLQVRSLPGLSLKELGDLGGSTIHLSAEMSKALALYEEDVGLRRLAAAKSGCFGMAFDADEKACQGCILAKRCARDSLLFYENVASDLDAATTRAMETAIEIERKRQIEEARTSQPVKEVVPAPAPDPKDPTLDSEDAVNEAQFAVAAQKKFGGKTSIVTIPFQGICSLCGKAVIKGTMGMHLPKVGMVHLVCALSPLVRGEEG